MNDKFPFYLDSTVTQLLEGVSVLVDRLLKEGILQSELEDHHFKLKTFKINDLITGEKIVNLESFVRYLNVSKIASVTYLMTEADTLNDTPSQIVASRIESPDTDEELLYSPYYIVQVLDWQKFVQFKKILLEQSGVSSKPDYRHLKGRFVCVVNGRILFNGAKVFNTEKKLSHAEEIFKIILELAIPRRAEIKIDDIFEIILKRAILKINLTQKRHDLNDIVNKTLKKHIYNNNVKNNRDNGFNPGVEIEWLKNQKGISFINPEIPS